VSLVYLGSIEIDEDGWYVVEFPDVPGVVTQGETPEEALDNARDALETMLDGLSEEGGTKEGKKARAIA
jgi:predicted RNase H-like HicB family nuclease